MKKVLLIDALLLTAITLYTVIAYNISFTKPVVHNQVTRSEYVNVPISTTATSTDRVYKGKIYNIFFHSLIVYPELAAKSKRSLYKDYMITRDEFAIILEQLYEHNFVLIDVDSIYNIDAQGKMTRKDLLLPEGKKALIISLDDLSYYRTQKGFGFANKLVIDTQGNVSTEVVAPDGRIEITRNGDVVPMLDDFVKEHPDFSIGGAKGIIALTGFDGILGYRTQYSTSSTRDTEIIEAKEVVAKLKETGWKFASHSYTHDPSFTSNKITINGLKSDIAMWDKEVRPLVGDTNIFVGPNGQIFKPNDERRKVLLDNGFKVLFGVGMDLYIHYFDEYVVMDRADIDGFRIKHSPELLKPFFDTSLVGSKTTL
ncbi:MAG: hypothetical protein V4576_01690 [Patescibacteria group bacterium]